MNTQTSTDEIRSLSPAELDSVSGGKLLHASFNLGCNRYTIVAGGEYGYTIIVNSEGDCRL